jgi:colanic acid/amylovoran biosynthesis glycosyltransferase
MRLAYLVSQYPTINHTFILREIRTLRKLGFEVHVFSIRGADRSPENLNQEEREESAQAHVVFQAGIAGIAVSHLNALARHPAGYISGLLYAFRLAGPDLHRAFLNLMYFGEAVVAGDWIRRLALRHVHSHFASTPALLAARVFPITFSATIHGPEEFNDVVGFYIAEKAARASFLRAISNYGCSQLMRASDPRHWSKLEVVPLGVNPGVFLPRPHRHSPARFEALCVGRLAAAKGHHILIAAMHRLVRERHRAIRLRLVGDGPDRPGLERRIGELGLQDHVQLEGSCNQDRVRQIYRETDLFVLASFAEGVPVVLMEAMAMEIPCVATWIAGVPELIRDGIDGCLVPPGDAEQVAGVIARLMDQPDLRQRLGRAGRARVMEKYDLERNTAQLADILRRRVSDGGSSGK